MLIPDLRGRDASAASRSRFELPAHRFSPRHSHRRVALRSIPLICSGCPSHLGPCLPAVTLSQATTPTSRPSSAAESVASSRCDPTFCPWLPWASCSSSECSGVPERFPALRPSAVPCADRRTELTRSFWMKVLEGTARPPEGRLYRSTSQVASPEGGSTAVGFESPQTEVRGSTFRQALEYLASNRSPLPSFPSC